MERSFIAGAISLIGLAVVLVPCCYAQNEPDDYLRVHNNARAAVGNSPLVWSEELAANASSYLTNNVLFKCKPNLQLTPKGVNVQVGASNTTDTVGLTGTGAVKIWISQKVNYNYKRNKCSKLPCAAFTQLVWRYTRYFGCARLQCLNNMSLTAIAGKYDPPGNIPGQRPYSPDVKF